MRKESCFLYSLPLPFGYILYSHPNNTYKFTNTLVSNLSSCLLFLHLKTLKNNLVTGHLINVYNYSYNL